MSNKSNAALPLFTPGPWNYDEANGRVLATEDGADVVVADLGNEGTAWPTNANGRLIAAAPELVEALEGLLANAPKPKNIQRDFSYTLYLESARRAIAKAKGG